MNEIVKHGLGIMDLGNVMADSKFFGCTPPQAITKILMGRELGMGDAEAMTKIHVIQGRPELSSNAIAAAVKSHPKYDYRVKENTSKKCVVEFFEINHDHSKESIGLSEYSIDDAKNAGLAGKNVWKQHPKAMLFARAISQGYRTHCPDVFKLTVYAEGEISNQIEEIVDVEPQVKRQEIEPKEEVVEIDAKRYGEGREEDAASFEKDGLKLNEMIAEAKKSFTEINPQCQLTEDTFSIKEKWIGLKAHEAHEWQELAYQEARRIHYARLKPKDRAWGLLAERLFKKRRRWNIFLNDIPSIADLQKLDKSIGPQTPIAFDDFGVKEGGGADQSIEQAHDWQIAVLRKAFSMDVDKLNDYEMCLVGWCKRMQAAHRDFISKSNESKAAKSELHKMGA